MSEIEVEKVTLDKLSIFQELNIQTFRETFAFDNTRYRTSTVFR
ncbi:Uncharacterised protein [Streptococcus pasteurianus]|nr:Uncharacterised protein [Streptococcus pasteurianus]